MIGDSEPSPSRKSNALLAIAVGGLTAGALDLTQASILFGWRVPLTIAAGVLGRGAFPWRHSHLLSGCPPALLYRLLSSGCLLRGESQARFFERAPAGVRLVLWRGG
jgi:hypothetical protein